MADRNATFGCTEEVHPELGTVITELEATRKSAVCEVLKAQRELKSAKTHAAGMRQEMQNLRDEVMEVRSKLNCQESGDSYRPMKGKGGKPNGKGGKPHGKPDKGGNATSCTGKGKGKGDVSGNSRLRVGLSANPLEEEARRRLDEEDTLYRMEMMRAERDLNGCPPAGWQVVVLSEF